VKGSISVSPTPSVVDQIRRGHLQRCAEASPVCDAALDITVDRVVQSRSLLLLLLLLRGLCLLRFLRHVALQAM